ncbi:MAG: DNA-binding protein [Thermodesulfobacteriota bacterium]
MDSDSWTDLDKQDFLLVTENIKVEDCSINIVAFRNILIAWGKEHFRPFPWRFTEDPYRILIAEVMLHRTQAIQVVPVYKRFIESYPDILTLSGATRKELHEILSSIGLRWRINLLQEMAAHLVTRFAGEVPRKTKELHSLPGVSDYIASAVRCFAWNLPEALIDTNTVRIAGRLCGLEVKDSSRRNHRFREIIHALVDPERPREFSYALLDLANQICVKKKPGCVECPVFKYCNHASALLANQVAGLTVA